MIPDYTIKIIITIGFIFITPYNLFKSCVSRDWKLLSPSLSLLHVSQNYMDTLNRLEEEGPDLWIVPPKNSGLELGPAMSSSSSGVPPRSFKNPEMKSGLETGPAMAPSSSGVRCWRTAFLTLRDETLASPPPTALLALLRDLILSHPSDAMVAAATDLPPHEVTLESRSRTLLFDL